MKTYQGSEIRNVAVVGHAHSGKTTLVSALLHAAKMTPTLGRVEDGSAVTAYDEEDVARATTMQNALAFAEWNGVKVNLVDTPGFHMFVHEARCAMAPVEAALVTVNAVTGVEPMTERVWKYAEEFNLPRAMVINQMDHQRAAASVECTSTASPSASAGRASPSSCPSWTAKVLKASSTWSPWKRSSTRSAAMATAKSAKFPRLSKSPLSARTKPWSSWSPKVKTS